MHAHRHQAAGHEQARLDAQPLSLLHHGIGSQDVLVGRERVCVHDVGHAAVGDCLLDGGHLQERGDGVVAGLVAREDLGRPVRPTAKHVRSLAVHGIDLVCLRPQPRHDVEGGRRAELVVGPPEVVQAQTLDGMRLLRQNLAALRVRHLHVQLGRRIVGQVGQVLYGKHRRLDGQVVVALRQVVPLLELLAEPGDLGLHLHAVRRIVRRDADIGRGVERRVQVGCDLVDHAHVHGWLGGLPRTGGDPPEQVSRGFALSHHDGVAFRIVGALLGHPPTQELVGRVLRKRGVGRGHGVRKGGLYRRHGGDGVLQVALETVGRGDGLHRLVERDDDGERRLRPRLARRLVSGGLLRLEDVELVGQRAREVLHRGNGLLATSPCARVLLDGVDVGL